MGHQSNQRLLTASNIDQTTENPVERRTKEVDRRKQKAVTFTLASLSQYQRLMLPYQHRG